MAGGIPASSGGNHLRELVPAVRKLWDGDYAHDGEIWQFPTSTSVPKPIQQPPPIWIAARDPESHKFAVRNGCNVMVTPLMKGDEEVVDLHDKFAAALAENPDVPRPDLMVLRHTYVHPADEPDGWVAGAEAVNRFIARSTPGSATRRPRWTASWTPARSRSSPNGPIPDRRPAQGRDDRHAHRGHRKDPDYQDLGVDEYSFWCDNGMSHEEKKRSLALFIEQVVPAFQ